MTKPAEIYRRLKAAAMPLLVAAGMFLYPVYVSANVVTSPRTEVALVSSASAIAAQERFWLALHIRMQPGWHTYWINPGDSGMVPSLEWTLPKGFAAGNIEFPPPDRLPVSDLVDFGYSNDAWLLVPVTAPPLLRPNAVSIVSLKARWLVCNDICIPESGNFSIALPTSTNGNQPGQDTDAVMEQVKKLPDVISRPVGFYVEKGKVNFDFPLNDILGGAVKSAEFYPVEQGFIINNAVQDFDVNDHSVSFTIPAEKGKLASQVQGVVSLHLKDGSRKDFAISLELSSKKPGAHFGVFKALLFALLGGFILNLMPCVFPILSLKALVVAKKAQKRPQEVKAHGLAYTFGVIASFLALAAVLIVLQIGGRSIGWGYHLQSPEFIAGLIVVFFFVALNLSGFFEMPALFGNLGGGIAARDSLIGSFATGALAVLVATPCTAPFMATAIGYALTQTAPVVIAIFAFLGLGLASPFLLISYYPALISWMPKPGEWMQTFRQALAFPMYLCTLWLLWVLVREVGVDAIFIVLLGLIFLALAIWLDTLDSFAFSMAGLVIGVLSIISIIGCLHFVPSRGMPADTEKFSILKLEELRKQGKGVFVDATADWCITCKVNESVALSSSAVRERFAEKGITVMVADWTHGDENITEYLKSFDRAGVPIYVYYPPGGNPVILPQVLTPSIVLKAVQ